MAVAYLEQSHAQALLRALAAIRPNSKRANMLRRRWYGMPCFRRPLCGKQQGIAGPENGFAHPQVRKNRLASYLKS